MSKKRHNLLFIIISDYNKDTKCYICGSKETYIQVRNGKGSPIWHNIEHGKICNKCHKKWFVTSEYRKQSNEKNKKYRLDYLGINLFLSFELPKNSCEICGISKNQGKKIDRHHYFYCRIMPWACTISVCSSCHTKIGNTGKIRVNSITRVCLLCGKNDNYKQICNKYKDGYICKICYNKNLRIKLKNL